MAAFLGIRIPTQVLRVALQDRGKPTYYKNAAGETIDELAEVGVPLDACYIIPNKGGRYNFLICSDDGRYRYDSHLACPTSNHRYIDLPPENVMYQLRRAVEKLGLDWDKCRPRFWEI